MSTDGANDITTEVATPAEQSAPRRQLGAGETDDEGHYKPIIDYVRWRLGSGKSARPLVDLIVTPNEVSFAHGTGVLMTRILDEAPPYILLRSFDHYGGHQSVKPEADYVLHRFSQERVAIGQFTANRLANYQIKRILVIAYTREDVIIALTAKALTGAPLTVYVMDDNCLGNDGIPRSEFEELLAVADARFVISDTMRDRYETAFRHKFWVMPPVVARKFLRAAPSPPAPRPTEARYHGVIVGNIWHQAWLDEMLSILEGNNVKITWFASSNDLYWLKLDERKMAAAGVEIRSNLPHEQIAKGVEEAQFVVVPSGHEGETDGHARAIAQLSLPSKMPFVTASSGTPFIVLTSGSGAGNYVNRFGLGEVVPYDEGAFLAAAARLADEDSQIRYRRRSFELAPTFDATGVYDILVGAAENKGHLANHRFEQLFKPRVGEFKYYIPSPPPPNTVTDEIETVQAFERIKALGWSPDFVLDIGASTGVWSDSVVQVFPEARYVLAEPLMSRYSFLKRRDNFVWEETAVSNEIGVARFMISADFYNSSLIKVSDASTQTEAVEVPLTTVDAIVERHNLSGRGILKVDVQYAEHLVIEGAVATLDTHCDFVMLELTMQQDVPEARCFREMMEMMDSLGFVPFDDVGGWRSPVTGLLEQKDFLFARRALVDTLTSIGR